MSHSHSLRTKEHHDPRIGDEDTSAPKSDPPDRVQPTQISPIVRPALEQELKAYCGKGKAEKVAVDTMSQHITSFRFKFELPSCLRWIPDNWTLLKCMTAIRCAVSEWVSLLLLIINPSTRAMGQVRSYAAYTTFNLWLSKGWILGSGWYVDSLEQIEFFSSIFIC
jgi:hypothetical protein